MSTWDKTKNGSKAAFDKGWGLFEKLGAPVNKLTNKIGSEAFWPTSLDHECDKSARILKSFCKDGFYKEQPSRPGSSSGPKNKPKVLVKIPQKVIKNCVGIAIFTVMRTGLWVSGAGGSGVLLARKEDGSWSPPSGILVHTLGVGFMAGIDIYDCVCVINSRQALDAFSKLRVSLGGEVSVVAGPLGVGGILDSEVTKDRKPVFSYMKSRGLYGGIQLDGTIIIERNDENARFYGERVGVKEILKGNVKRVPPETRMLMEVVKEAEGRTDLDQNVLNQAQGPAPGDLEVENMSRPTEAQQQQYAPPQGYYPPEKPQGTYGAGEPTHPYHPGPPDGQSGYYQPPPQQQAQGPNQASYQQAPGQAGYYPPPQHQGQGSNQAPYYPPPPGYNAGASGAPQQAYNPTSYHPQTQASSQTPYFPPPPPGPPPK